MNRRQASHVIIAAWPLLVAIRIAAAVGAGTALVAPPAVAAQSTESRAAASPDEARTRARQLGDSVAASVRAGRLADAERIAREATAVVERAFGPRSREAAEALMLEANVLISQEKWGPAVPLLERVRALPPEAHGPDGELGIQVTVALGQALFGLEDYHRAEVMLTEGVARLQEAAARRSAATAVRPDSAELLLAWTFTQLGDTQRQLGRHQVAEVSIQRALELYRRLAPGSVTEAQALRASGLLAFDLGELDSAEARLSRSFELLEQHENEGRWGHVVALQAQVLNDLSMGRSERGDPAGAEMLLRRSLAKFEAYYGAESPRLIAALANLSLVYMSMGDLRRAEDVLGRAVRLAGAGPVPPATVGFLLDRLASLHFAAGDLEGASEFLRRSIGYLEKGYGKRHQRVAVARANLGVTYHAMGDLPSAEWLYRDALDEMIALLGSEHPGLAFTRINLAMVYVGMRKYREAERLYLLALASSRAHYGESSPPTIATLLNLAQLDLLRGDLGGATRWMKATLEAREAVSAAVLGAGSESQKRRFLAWDAGVTYQVVSTHLRGGPPASSLAPVALTSVLRWKGRALDATAGQLSAATVHLVGEDRSLLDSLQMVRRRMSALVWRAREMADSGRSLRALQARAEALEGELARKSGEYRTIAAPVTLDAVRRMIRAGAALVEYVSFQEYDIEARRDDRRFGKPRLGVYVLRADGSIGAADLGPAARIDAAVEAMRAALSDPASEDVRAAARALDELVMRPVRALVGDASRLLVAPDGQMNLIPFAALVDEDDRYLVERYAISYLTSGRDLLRIDAPGESVTAAVVMGAPAYDRADSVALPDRPGAESGEAALRRSADPGDLRWDPLPGTAAEAEALAGLLTGARLFTGGAASEARLKSLDRPALLHLATHGFFLPPRTPSSSRPRTSLPYQEAPELLPPPPAPADDPLLRAGLVLAGANLRAGGGGEDGILTALEAAGLDLWGTELVVLSACETGVGTVATGEGVLGLRRAFTIAGARSQLMSLWRVNDRETRALMIRYYERIGSGAGRADALVEVQRQMLVERPTLHPYFWASFIPAGDWRPLPAHVRGAGGARRGEVR